MNFKYFLLRFNVFEAYYILTEHKIVTKVVRTLLIRLKIMNFLDGCEFFEYFYSTTLIAMERERETKNTAEYMSCSGPKYFFERLNESVISCCVEEVNRKHVYHEKGKQNSFEFEWLFLCASPTCICVRYIFRW
jgi:hypothetical protein